MGIEVLTRQRNRVFEGDLSDAQFQHPDEFPAIGKDIVGYPVVEDGENAHLFGSRVHGEREVRWIKLHLLHSVPFDPDDVKLIMGPKMLELSPRGNSISCFRRDRPSESCFGTQMNGG